VSRTKWMATAYKQTLLKSKTFSWHKNVDTENKQSTNVDLILYHF